MVGFFLFVCLKEKNTTPSELRNIHLFLKIIWYALSWREKDFERRVHHTLQLTQEEKWRGKHWSPLWCSVIGPKETAWDCVRGHLHWILGKDSSPGRWLGTRDCSPGRWSHHQDCQRSKSVWTMLSATWFRFRVLQGVVELDLMISLRPCWLEIFCDSLITSQHSTLVIWLPGCSLPLFWKLNNLEQKIQNSLSYRALKRTMI